MKEWVDKISKPYNLSIESKLKYEQLEKDVQTEIERIIDEEECDEFQLSRLCEYIKTGKNIKVDDRNGSLYPYYGTTKIMAYTDNDGYYEGMHICVARKGNFNVMLINHKFHVNDDVIIIKPLVHKYNPQYIFFLIKNEEKTIAEKYNGSTVKGIARSELEQIRIKIPKDKKIMSALDPKFKLMSELQEICVGSEFKYKELIKQLSEEAIGKNQKNMSLDFENADDSNMSQKCQKNKKISMTDVGENNLSSVSEDDEEINSNFIKNKCGNKMEKELHNKQKNTKILVRGKKNINTKLPVKKKATSDDSASDSMMDTHSVEKEIKKSKIVLSTNRKVIF